MIVTPENEKEKEDGPSIPSLDDAPDMRVTQEEEEEGDDSEDRPDGSDSDSDSESYHSDSSDTDEERQAGRWERYFGSRVVDCTNTARNDAQESDDESEEEEEEDGEQRADEDYALWSRDMLVGGSIAASSAARQSLARAILENRRVHDPDAVMAAGQAREHDANAARREVRPSRRFVRRLMEAARPPEPPAPVERAPVPFGPEYDPDGPVWTHMDERHADIYDAARQWEFGFHDFPDVFRTFGGSVSFVLSLLPAVLAVCFMLETYPGLVTVQIVTFLMAFSFLISRAPVSLKTLYIWVKYQMTVGFLALRQFYYLRDWRARLHYPNNVDDPQGMLVSICIGRFFTISGMLLCGAIVLMYASFDYVEFMWRVASLFADWEVDLIRAISPTYFQELWLYIPTAFRHIIAWSMWGKWLLATYYLLSYYTSFIIRASSYTTVKFVRAVEYHHGGDLRSHAFRNQDLLEEACPVELRFTRRILGIFPIMSQTKTASATMIMELTSHKFLNGAVKLPDTADRINRAMKGIGYINLDASDVFRNHDLAEISRLTAIS